MKLVLGTAATPVANQLMARASTVPIVLISDTGRAEDVWSSISAGAVDVLSRPLCKSKLQTLWLHTVRHQNSTVTAQPIVGSPAMQPSPIMSSSSSPSASKVSASKSNAESKKRKAKEMSGPIVAARPPLAIKPNCHAAAPPAFTYRGPVPVTGPKPAITVQQPPMVGYWSPSMMPGSSPTVIQGNAPLSWGHPVVGMPAAAPPVGVLPGQVPRWTGGPIPIAMPPQFQMVQAGVAPVPVSCAMPMSHPRPVSPLKPATYLPATNAKPHQSPQPLKAGKSKVKEIQSGKELSSPTRSESSCSGSEDFALCDMIAAEDLVSIPEPDGIYEVSSASVEDFMTSCNPTALDDISEEEYSFVEFALSDAFPAMHEDDILPALGLSLKKSDSFLNIHQMVA